MQRYEDSFNWQNNVSRGRENQKRENRKKVMLL